MSIRKEIKDTVKFLNDNIFKIELGFNGEMFSIQLPNSQDKVKVEVATHLLDLGKAKLSIVSPYTLPVGQANNIFAPMTETTDIILTYWESVYLNRHSKKIINRLKYIEKNKELLESHKLLRTKLKFLSDNDFNDKVNKVIFELDENKKDEKK